MPESDINIDTQGVELGYDLTCALPGLIWMIQRIIFIIVPWLFYHIGFTSVQKHAQIMCSGLHGISSDNLHMKRRVFLWAQINHLTKCRAHDTLGDSAWLPSGYKWLRKWVSQYSKCVRVSESACTSLTSLTHRPLPFPFAPHKCTSQEFVETHPGKRETIEFRVEAYTGMGGEYFLCWSQND